MNLADAAATAALARQKKQPNVSLSAPNPIAANNDVTQNHMVDDLLNNLEAENDATPEVENIE